MDDDDGGVAQHGGHTPKSRLTETCSLGLPCTSLTLDIHAKIQSEDFTKNTFLKLWDLLRSLKVHDEECLLAKN